MSRVNKNRKLNILDAYYHREIGMSNRHHITQELLATAEDRLVSKEHDELSCEMPGMPRSTFLMVFSPDGTKVASTHGNHNVYVTDLQTGKNCNTLIGHPRTPWCIAFHPSSNQILATGCLGGQVRIWDLSGGSEVWTTDCQTVIASLAFHPHDRLLVIATYNVLYFWDWSQPKPFMQTCTNNAKEKVRYVAFDRLGHKLITGIANMQACGTRAWERTRSSHPSFSQPSSITRGPHPDIYIVRPNAYTWYTRRVNRAPRPSAFQTPARQLNPTSFSSNTNVNSNNNNNNSNSNSSQNETDGSVSYYERRIIQLYESLMQRFLEEYRTRAISTTDRGTDPMEPIPLNSTTAQTVITNTASTTTSVSSTHTTTNTTTTTTTTTPPSPPTISTSPKTVEASSSTNSTINSPPKEVAASTTQQNCKSPEAGPSGIQTTNKKRPRSKKTKRRNVLQSDDEDSSSSSDTSSSSNTDGSNTELSPIMNLILKHITSDGDSIIPSMDQQPSTSKTKSKGPKNLRKDRERKIGKRKKEKPLNFIIPDEDNEAQSEDEVESTHLRQEPERQPNVTIPNFQVELYQPMETPESASDSAVSFMSSMAEEGVELDYSHILPTDEDDTHFLPNQSEPTQIDTSQWRSRNIIPPGYIPDPPSTSSASTRGDYLHAYGDDDVPVDLSSNGYTIDEEETTDQQRPHVDHNYMASTSSSTNSATPSSSSSRGESHQSSVRPDKRARAEMRQLQFIRYMCHKFQELLNVNQHLRSPHGSSSTHTVPPRHTESTRNPSAQLHRRNSYPRTVTFRPGDDDIIPSTSNPSSSIPPSTRILSFRADIPSTSNSTQSPPTANPPSTSTANTRIEKSSLENTNSSNLTTRQSNSNLGSESTTPWCNRRLHVHHHHRLNRHVFLPRMQLGSDVRRHSNLPHLKTQNDAVNLSRTDTNNVSTQNENSNQRNHTNPITITEAIRRLQRSNASTVRRRTNFVPSTLLKRTDNNETASSNSSQLEGGTNPSNLNLSQNPTTSAERGLQGILKIQRKTNFISSVLGKRTDTNEIAPSNSSQIENNNNQNNLNTSQIPTTSAERQITQPSVNDLINSSSNTNQPNSRRRENSQNQLDSSQSNNELYSPPRKMMKCSVDDKTEPTCSTTDLERQNIQGNSQSNLDCVQIPEVNNTKYSTQREETSQSEPLPSNSATSSHSNHVLCENSQNNLDSPRIPSTSVETNNTNSSPRGREELNEYGLLSRICTIGLHSYFDRHARRKNNQSTSQVSNTVEPSRSTTTSSAQDSQRSSFVRRHLRRQRLTSTIARRRILLLAHRLRLFPPSSSAATTSSNTPGSSGGRASSENGTSSSSSSSDNQSSPISVRKFFDINENMRITSISIRFIIRRLDDLIRQQHTPQQTQNVQSSPTTRYELQIYLRLLSLHSRLTRLGVQLDHSSSFLDDRISGVSREDNGNGRDVEYVYQGRDVLSIILIILMRYYENQNHLVSPPTPRILTERLALMLRLSIILTDTLLLNVFERLPAPDMRDSHEYIASTFRAIDDRRLDALHERRRNLQNERSSQRSNYYIEDLSRMSVNDDPNEIVPEAVASTPPTSQRGGGVSGGTTSSSIDNQTSSSRRWDMEPELVPLSRSSAETLLSRMRESQTRFREFFNTPISNIRNLRRSINNHMRAYNMLNDMQRTLVPRVQVNDVPVNDDAVINRPVQRMELPDYLPLSPMPLMQRTPQGTFRPRFLHPLYGGGGGGGGILVDGDIDDTQREQIFGMGDDFPASACPNHRIQIWNMADGRIPNITNPDKNVVVSDCKIHNDASVDISQDGNLLVTLLPSGGYLNITNKLGVFSIQWDNLGQCLYTASFEQNAVSVSLSTTARYLAVGLASRRVSSLVPGSERCIMAQLYKLETDGRTLLARDIEKSRNLGTTSINCIRWSPVPGQGLVYATNSGHLKVLS